MPDSNCTASNRILKRNKICNLCRERLDSAVRRKVFNLPDGINSKPRDSIVRAIRIKEDANRGLWLGEARNPECRCDEVLIRVRATAVNRADLLQRRGLYPPPPGESDILGLEAAGEIAAMGEGVTGWQVGDRVFCLLGGGGYAELVKAHHQMLLPMPPGWTFEQAAAAPEAFYTAFVNLFLEAAFQPGEILLLHAGASGVGTAAIQLARNAGGLVIVTAGSDEKLVRCVELGANHGINYKTSDFEDVALKLTNHRGVDVVLDCVGAPYFAKSVSVLRTQGRLVLIGLLGGAKTEIDLTPLLRKRLHVIGSTLRTRSLQEKIAITEQFRRRVLPYFERGNFQAVIDRVFPLAEAEQAHEYVLQNKNFGKVVLQVG